MDTGHINDRINAKLTETMAIHVAHMVGNHGNYETPSEYIRDLIRKDMAKYEARYIGESILEGYKDFAEGRYFKSTGSFEEDRKIFNKKKKNGWK